jgi:hypothetical protein
MQAVTVAAASTHKFEVEDVALGCSGLVVGNPLLNGQGVFAGFHAGTLQKVQRSVGPLSRTIGGVLLAFALSVNLA